MKKLALLAFLIFPAGLFAQNWMPITAVDTYHFAIDSVSYPSHTIWVESVETKNERTIYHLNKVVQPCDTCDYWNYSYYNNPDSLIVMSLYDQPQFLNNKVELDKNGCFWFVDPGMFLLKLHAGINQSWVFDSLNNITAKVIDIKTEIILGNSDSVKIILLSNSDSIILSKNHGITQFPEFKNNKLNYRLVGIQNRNIGLQLPTLFDIYNFQVGDRFQYYTNRYQNHENYYYTTNYKMIDKVIDNNKVTYDIDGFRVGQYFGQLKNIYEGDLKLENNPQTYYFYFNEDENINQVLNNNKLIKGQDNIPNIYDKIRVSQDNQGNIIIIKAGFCGHKSINSCRPFYVDSNLKTKGSEYLLFPENAYVISGFEVFKEGFGEISSSYSGFEIYSKRKLIGYIKNGVKHGEILDYNLVSVEDDINNKISISPNPFTKNIVFTSEEDFEMQLTVYDISGKECLSYRISTNQYLNLSFLEKGTYILKIISGEQVLMKRVIKQ
jgi:hypothetical protein